MKPSFLLFCVVAFLSFVAGFYFHEGLNEKTQYEREQCFDFVDNIRTERSTYNLSTYNFSDVIENEPQK